MAPQIVINFGLCNGLVPNGTKPLPKPILTYHQWEQIHLMTISQEMLKRYIMVVVPLTLFQSNSKINKIL